MQDTTPRAHVSLHIRQADGSMQEVARHDFPATSSQQRDAALLAELNAERAARKPRRSAGLRRSRLRRLFAAAARILRALGACFATLLLCYFIGGGVMAIVRGTLAIICTIFNI